MGLDLAHRPGLLTNEIELRHKARIRQKIVFRIYPARSRCHSRSMGRSISGLTFRAHWTAIKGGLSRGIFTAAAGEIYFASHCQRGVLPTGGHFVEAHRDGVPGAIAAAGDIWRVCCD